MINDTSKIIKINIIYLSSFILYWSPAIMNIHILVNILRPSRYDDSWTKQMMEKYQISFSVDEKIQPIVHVGGWVN